MRPDPCEVRRLDTRISRAKQPPAWPNPSTEIQSEKTAAAFFNLCRCFCQFRAELFHSYFTLRLWAPKRSRILDRFGSVFSLAALGGPDKAPRVGVARATRGIRRSSLTNSSEYCLTPPASPPGQFVRATRRKNQCFGDGSRLRQRNSRANGPPSADHETPRPAGAWTLLPYSIVKDRVTEPILSDKYIVVYMRCRVKGFFGPGQKDFRHGNTQYGADSKGKNPSRIRQEAVDTWPSETGSKKALLDTLDDSRIIFWPVAIG